MSIFFGVPKQPLRARATAGAHGTALRRVCLFFWVGGVFGVWGVVLFGGVGPDTPQEYIVKTGENVTAVKISGNTISNLKAITSPKGGHGWNSSRELGGNNIVVKTTFSGLGTGSSTKSTSDTLFVDNDYRHISLVRNPVIKSSQYDVIDTGDTSITYGTRSTGDYLDQRLAFTVSSIVSGETDVAQYGPDVLVTQTSTGATGKIINYYTSPNILWLRPISGTFDDSNNLVGTINSTQTTIGVNALVDYDGLRYSGEVMYIENRGLSNREVSTTDDIRIIIKF